MSYEIESKYYRHGYLCVVIMTDMGHRCGYVGIPEKHPLYRQDAGKKASCLETVRPTVWFNVHGGITFSGFGRYRYPLFQNVAGAFWWYGYDCADYGDAPDTSRIKDPRRRGASLLTGVVRSLDYCINECNSLADQLKEVEDANN